MTTYDRKAPVARCGFLLCTAAGLAGHTARHGNSHRSLDTPAEGGKGKVRSVSAPTATHTIYFDNTVIITLRRCSASPECCKCGTSSCRRCSSGRRLPGKGCRNGGWRRPHRPRSFACTTTTTTRRPSYRGWPPVFPPWLRTAPQNTTGEEG